jgi:hypothetical protein
MSDQPDSPTAECRQIIEQGVAARIQSNKTTQDATS